MNGVPDRRKLVPPHLADSVLLEYLDGELARAETQNARAHLEGCWTCRRRLAALETSIANFLDQRMPLQPQLAVDGEQRVRQFRERLERHAAGSALSIRERLGAAWQALAAGVSAHRRAALASVVAVCLLVAMFTDVLATRVSADTVLYRAQASEAAHRPYPGQVARAAIRVERIQQRTGTVHPLGTITLIEDSEQPQASLTSESTTGGRAPAVLASLGKTGDGASPQIALLPGDLPASVTSYLRSQHWLPTVTVETFQRLTAERGLTTTSVQKEADAFVLIYPFADGHPSGISEARLRVDRNNFTTMGLSFFLGTPPDRIEYRFTRQQSLLEPRTNEIAALFQPHDLTKSSRSLPAREPAKILPLSYATTSATDNEVRLAAALHGADACLGEELHVFPMSDGSLLVQGLVDKAERRDAIVKALRAVDPAIPSQIFLPRELKSGSQLFDLPYRTPDLTTTRTGTTATLADLSSQRIPLYEQLYQHFSRPGATPDETEKQINAFSNESVTLARQTFLHAWALKKLELEFSAERSARLSPSAVQELERMRQDHRRWIAAISHRQSEMLSQVGGTSAKPLVTDGSNALDADTLLRLSREQNDLVRSLFTISNSSPETESNVARLLAVLHRMGA